MTAKPGVPSKTTLAIVATFITAAVVTFGIIYSGAADAASDTGQNGVSSG